ncbi:hypothetical protein FRC10_010434 [Ceratobasidium sp. 414]|nr:hypothetical protein FRC10_010434 [Ceratobasidium sp. 414]
MSPSSTLLNGKKVLIIGGSSGIGRGVAAAALSNGASVVIASSTQSKVDAAVELIRKGIEGKQDLTVSRRSCNIKDFAALTGFLTKLLSTIWQVGFDRSGGNIITAGKAPKGPPPADVDVREVLQDSMDSRYWAVLTAANHIHKHKLVRPGGSLIMTIGAAQQRPIAGWGFNLGAAGAVETATRTLAVDLKPLR